MLAQVGYIKSNTLDEAQLQDVIMDIVTAAIRSTDVTFDLYRWSEFPDFVKRQPAVATTPLDSYNERTAVSMVICRAYLAQPTVHADRESTV